MFGNDKYERQRQKWLRCLILWTVCNVSNVKDRKLVLPHPPDEVFDVVRLKAFTLLCYLSETNKFIIIKIVYRKMIFYNVLQLCFKLLKYRIM